MIQRVQSVYLAVSLCLLVAMFISPLAVVVYETVEFLHFDLTGWRRVEAGEMMRVSWQYSLLAFGLLICALNVVTVFMYKRRVLQLRLCVYNMLLLTGLVGVVLFTLYSLPGVTLVQFRLAALFPVISVILHWLAFRGIRRDELMVQALSRLR